MTKAKSQALQVVGITKNGESRPVLKGEATSGDGLHDHEAQRLSDLFNKHGLSKNTQRAYQQGWRDFVDYCSWRKHCAMPADPKVVAAYLAWLSGDEDEFGRRESGLTKSTISLRQNAIAFVHDVANLETLGYVNPARHKLVDLTMKAVRNKLSGVKQDQAEALTFDQLKKVISALPRNQSYLRDKALLLIGYAGAFRRSELVALTMTDITIDEEGVKIVVQKSKTDQEGEGQTKFISRLPHPMFCPVIALERWLDDAKITEGALFRRIFTNGRVGEFALSDKSVEMLVRQAAENAGLRSPEKYSGHSLRAGFVTTAANNGAKEWDIREQTGHKSLSTLRRYIRTGKENQTRATNAAFGKVQ